MTTLASFLGGGKQGGSYQTTTYRFKDRSIYENEQYFGLVLAKKIKPQRLILLGTAGSMWDVFFESGLSDHEQQWEALSQAVTENSVTQEHLSTFEKFLSEQLQIEVSCRLIDYAKDQQGQVNILRQLDEILTEQEQVTLDVTHGFRHLPMIALVAARYLKISKNITIEHIYYGSYVPAEKISEVLELKGLLDMLDWVSALDTFDKDGDYSVFSSLLIDAGLDDNTAQELSLASFFERNINASDASRKLSQVMPKLEELRQKSTALYELFFPQLQKRLDWYKKSSLGLQEQSLAEKYLKREDYLRAVIYAMEGKISRTIQIKDGEQDVHSFEKRKQTYDELVQDEQYRIFKEFRNSMVHGIPANLKAVKSIISDPEKLKQSLLSRLKNLSQS